MRRMRLFNSAWNHLHPPHLPRWSVDKWSFCSLQCSFCSGAMLPANWVRLCQSTSCHSASGGCLSSKNSLFLFMTALLIAIKFKDAQCSEALNEPDQNELIPEECQVAIKSHRNTLVEYLHFEIQGQKIECPTPPNDPAMICKASYVPGRCCPDYSCVSANPPSIDVCEV